MLNSKLNSKTFSKKAHSARTSLGNGVKFSPMSIVNRDGSNLMSKLKPPSELYKAAAVITLLTASALEGAGTALNQAIQQKAITKKEASNVMRSMLQQGGSPMQRLQSANGVPSLNLPPGVKDTTDLILDLAGKAKTIVGDGIEIATKKSFDVASGLLTDAIDQFVPTELLNTPYSELNPKLTRQLSNIAKSFESMASDPQARQAITNLAKAVTNVSIEAINAAKPQIDRLVARVWEVANNVGSKSIRSAMNVGMAMLITALAEIPGVGGVLVGGLEAGSIFNNVVETGSKAIQGMTEIAADSMKTLSTVASTVGASENQLTAPINQVKQVYNKFSSGMQVPTNVSSAMSNMSSKVSGLRQSATEKMSNMARRLPVQTAGGERRRIRRRTRRIQKQINKTIKRFLG